MAKKKTKHYEDILEQGKELIGFYLDNPCIAAQDLLGVDFAPIQRLVFNDMWFKDYVIAVCSRGFGKSTYVSEMVHIKGKGLVHLDEVLPPIPNFLGPGEDTVVDYSCPIYTSEGFRNSKKLCLEKSISGKMIETRIGLIKRGSCHHPLLTLNDKCEFVYKNLSELSVGDKVCIQRDQNIFGSTSIDIDDAYLIGLLIGDGHLVHNTSLTTNDSELLDFCKCYCHSRGIHYSIAEINGSQTTKAIRFSNKMGLIKKHGVERALSYSKSVPYSLRTSTREVQIAFLQGYFDTDGTVNRLNGGVSCCSVSRKLLEEIQVMLLNFGIVSRLREKKTKSKFGRAYLLDMYSKDAYTFSELIGFRLKRKQDIVDNYFNTKIINVNNDTIPYVKDMCRDIANEYRSKNGTRHDDPYLPSLEMHYSNCKEYTYGRLHAFVARVNYLISENFLFSKDSILKLDKLTNVLKYHYFYDTVKVTEDWVGDCYDFEMDMEKDVEPNYFSNGFINHNTFGIGALAALSAMLKPGYRVGLISPSFRQSKMIFAEIEKLYAQSSIFREACEKPPIRGTDSCYVKFKSVGGMAPSYIEAVPLGNDGGKIRGSRFYLIVVDELAQIPDQVLDMVVKPMAATSLAPMERVHRIEQQKKLISLGLADSSDFEKEAVNKMIMTSSGYYKFNHMWRRMKDHWQQIDDCNRKDIVSPYAVWQIPYWDLPEGFLDMNNIESAKRTMSQHEFSMEYEAAMISDSEGFFKASAIEQCTIGSGFNIESHGDKSAQYVVGVDPNQGGRASTGVVIIKIGQINKVVSVLELKNKTTQELTMAIQSVCDTFNVVRVFMDKGGGGKALCDLLEEGYGGSEPIIDRTNDDHRSMPGRHILEMVVFNPSWISDANFTTKALIEAKELLFPEPLTGSILDNDDLSYTSIRTLKSQMLNIVVTQTSTGMLHFDTPSKNQNKDLYSALILSAHGAKVLARESEEDQGPVLYSSSGMLRPHNSHNDFRAIGDANIITSYTPITHAILKKKIK